jgi:hypothetical protein
MQSLFNLDIDFDNWHLSAVAPVSHLHSRKMKTGEDESVPDPQAIDKIPARRIALTLAATLPPIVLSVIAEVRGDGLLTSPG